MGEKLLKKTRVALVVESTIEAISKMNNTMMDFPVLKMSCSSIEDMIKVTRKIFGPAATETIIFPVLLVYCNVINRCSAVRGTFTFFDPLHQRLTEGFMTNEVTCYVEAINIVVRLAQGKKPTTEVIFVSLPGHFATISLPIDGRSVRPWLSASLLWLPT